MDTCKCRIRILYLFLRGRPDQQSKNLVTLPRGPQRFLTGVLDERLDKTPSAATIVLIVREVLAAMPSLFFLAHPLSKQNPEGGTRSHPSFAEMGTTGASRPRRLCFLLIFFPLVGWDTISCISVLFL